MLEKFSVENFLSLRDKFTLNLVPKSATELKGNLLSPVYMKYSVLKGIGIFGINSIGKSNLIKALNFAREFVLGKTGGVEHDNIGGVVPFLLDLDYSQKPSSFEFEFWINNHKYKYGFVVDKKQVHEEWLYLKETQKEKVVFIRANNSFSVGRGYKKELAKFVGVVQPNELFLTFAARCSIHFAVHAVSWFRNIIILLESNPQERAKSTIELLKNPVYKLEIESIMKGSGFGIESLDLSQVGEYKTVQTSRPVFKDSKFVSYAKMDMLSTESSGTIKYFGLLGPILKALRNGSLLIIDEFDAGFHSLLALHLVRLFQMSSTTERTPQLIFVSHNQDMWDLNVLRRDQQLHMDKGKYGETVAKTTFDYGLRKDKSVKRSYSKSKLSKIPVLADFQLKLDFEK